MKKLKCPLFHALTIPCPLIKPLKIFLNFFSVNPVQEVY